MDFCINWWIVKEHAKHSFPSSIENASQKRTCQKCARCTLNNKLKAESPYFTQRLSLNTWHDGVGNVTTKCIANFSIRWLMLRWFLKITFYFSFPFPKGRIEFEYKCTKCLVVT